MTGESTSFFNTPLGNPAFRENQIRAIESIQTKPWKRVLPEYLHSHVESNVDTVGKVKVRVNQEEIRITGQKNNVLTVQVWNIPQGDQVASFLPQLKSYFFIDLHPNSGYAFDVSQLWAISPDVKPGTAPKEASTKFQDNTLRVVEAPTRGSGFLPDGLGGELYLQDLIESDFQLNKQNPVTQKTLDLLNRISPVHEAAHRLQFHKFADIRENKGLTDLVGILFINQIMSKSPGFARIVNILPSIKKYLKRQKAQQREIERNAHAFTLRAMRQLKRNNIDLARGYTNTEILSGINQALNDYDEIFKYVDGDPFSKHNL